MSFADERLRGNRAHIHRPGRPRWREAPLPAASPFGAATQFFFDLIPERVLAAVEAEQQRCSGRFLVLNSYENRVYQLELEAGGWVVGKFYRPGRWTREQILDEHRFLLDLQEAEFPVAAPLPLACGSTLAEVAGIHFALFPRIGGRSPDEMAEEELRRLGHQLGRLHMVARRRTAPHRPKLDAATWGRSALRYLLDEKLLPHAVRGPYQQVALDCLKRCEGPMSRATVQRIHGDCHVGNLLLAPSGLHFLDFDDCCTGPPVQDLWMLWGGRDAWAMRRRDVILDAYEEILPFDRGSLALVEPLRTLRYLHWAAWIAKRRDDPAFRIAFPDFGSEGFWMRALQDLQEQQRVLADTAS